MVSDSRRRKNYFKAHDSKLEFPGSEIEKLQLYVCIRRVRVGNKVTCFFIILRNFLEVELSRSNAWHADK